MHKLCSTGEAYIVCIYQNLILLVCVGSFSNLEFCQNSTLFGTCFFQLLSDFFLMCNVLILTFLPLAEKPGCLIHYQRSLEHFYLFLLNVLIMSVLVNISKTDSIVLQEYT